MKSTKNSYKNTENEKEKAMTTDQVWPVGHFFADDQAAKEARKQVLLKEAEKKAKEVSELLNDKWEKAIAPEKVIAPESDEDQNNAGENESKTQPASIEDELYHMAERYVLGLKSRYWRIDGKYYSVFDTREVKLIIERTINPESFDTPNNLVSINHALRACLKQGLVPAALQPKDKEKFEQLINLFEKKKNGLTDPYGHVVTEVASSSVMGQFFSKVVQVSKKESIGEKKLDPSIGKELREIAKQCEYTPLSHIQFWKLESPTSNVILDTKIPALYPVGDRYVIYASSDDIYIEDDDECQKWIEEKTKGIKGFKFGIPTARELKTSFQDGYHTYNPYMDELYGMDDLHGRICMASTGEAHSYWNVTNISKISEKLWAKIRDSKDGSYAVIPICRLKEGVENDFSDSLTKSLLVCLENGLVPKSMESSTKSRFRELIAQYKKTKVKDLTSVLTKASKAPAPAPKPNYADILSKLKLGVYKDSDGKTEDCQLFQQLKDYISQKDGKLSFDMEKFMKAVREGSFKKTVNDFDYDINSRLASGEGSPEQRKAMELSNCDYYRANLAAYPVSWLTNENYGSWELFEEMNHPKGGDSTPVSGGKKWMARPPQLDVKKNGICAIDFGTRSTTVVCKDEENGERLLPVGEGLLDRAPEIRDYENPTSMEFRDLDSFLKAYYDHDRKGRPFTKWNDLFVSHAAADALSQGDQERSGFDELKQWANDPGREISLKDEQGNAILLKPFDKIEGEDFNPIELYAYYLGLYINNQYNGIYLKYMMSYPVNYSVQVRENIRKSFEKGLKKSLPPAILADEKLMKTFSVTMPASEPAAYAMEALKELNLDATEESGTAYGVFDFGGGTTDFDFGMEDLDDFYDYKLRQFGAGGDVYLGGENLLALMAYEVYRANVDEMRKKSIPLILPFEERPFDGAGLLVEERSKASSAACMNMRILQEMLRDLWESQSIPEKYRETMTVSLYSLQSDKKVSVDLKIDAGGLKELLEKRIGRTVDQFFIKLMKVFIPVVRNKNIRKIHIFMAGNSSKSLIVWKLMNDHVDQLNRRFEDIVKAQGFLDLHPALGNPVSGSDEEKDERPLSEKPTGKTGVAFGLLRCREEGNDVLVVNENDISLGEKKEASFPYYLGLWRRHKFECKIKKSDPYGVWIPFVPAMKKGFEIRYTADDRVFKPGLLKDGDVATLTCYIDDDEISREKWIYVRRTDISTIQYTVQTEEERKAGKEPSEPDIHTRKLQ